MSDGQDLPKIYETLGGLAAQMNIVIERLAQNEVRQNDIELRASENRSRLYEKVEGLALRMQGQEQSQVRLEAAVTSANSDMKVWMKDIDARLGDVENEIQSHAAVLNDAKPAIKLVRTWEQRVIGMALLLAAFSFMLGALLVNFKNNLAKMFLPG